jgi:hypothetical protein
MSWQMVGKKTVLGYVNQPFSMNMQSCDDLNSLTRPSLTDGQQQPQAMEQCRLHDQHMRVCCTISAEDDAVISSPTAGESNCDHELSVQCMLTWKLGCTEWNVEQLQVVPLGKNRRRCKRHRSNSIVDIGNDA